MNISTTKSISRAMIISLLVMHGLSANGQTDSVFDKTKGESHFMVVGLVNFGMAFYSTTTTDGVSEKVTANSFGDQPNYEWSPMLLWRHSDNLLLEFEPSFDGSSIGVNWACASYFVTPGLIVRAGFFVLPFGIYSKRLAAGWINKMSTDPLGVADLPPGSDWGVEAEGGFPLGSMKWSYDVSLTNGMQLLDDGEIQNANGDGIVDNNKNKTITARLGLLPLSNSSLEIGVSGLFGKVGDEGSAFENASASMFAGDISYVNDINPFTLNIKGQYNLINITKENYSLPDDSAGGAYTFDNVTTTYFGMIALRPTKAKSVVVKNLEAAFRYANLVTPKNSLWGQNSNEIEIGLNYWLTWRTVVRASYQIVNSTNYALGNEVNKVTSNTFYLSASTEF